MDIWVDANGWPVPLPLLIGCFVAEILYFRGWGVLTRAAQAKAAINSRKRSIRPSATDVSNAERQQKRWFWRSICFIVALFVFLVASSTLIDTLSSRWFWVHMVQHLLLLVIMAPLMIASAPWLPMWLGLPRWARRGIKRLRVGQSLYQVGRWLRQPALVCGLLVMGTWIWHWPPLYDLALSNTLIHDWCEHTTFLMVSLLFWSQVIPSPPLHARTGYLGRISCVGVAIVQNVVLAVLIGFAGKPLYAPYFHRLLWSGAFSAEQDQQLAAGIMWTFGDLPFGIAFSMMVHQWLISQSDDADTASIATTS